MVAGLVDTFGAVIMLGSDIWFTNMDIDIMSLVKPDSALTMGQDPCADIPANGDFSIFQNTPKTGGLLQKIGKIQDRAGKRDSVIKMPSKRCCIPAMLTGWTFCRREYCSRFRSTTIF